MFEREKYREVNYPDDQLLVAGFQSYTRSHGPGNRCALWLQGCLKYCPGCINPEMLKVVTSNNHNQTNIQHEVDDGFATSLFRQEDLLTEIRLARDSVANIRGLTIMGGEPMLQARNLTTVLKTIRQEKPTMNVLLFTGYFLEDLRALNNQAINNLLEEVDTLIDGEFFEESFDPTRIAGSKNQKIIHFTDAMKDADSSRRGQEIGIKLGERKLEIIQSGIKIPSIDNSST